MQKHGFRASQIPPTQLVDRSRSAYTRTRPRPRFNLPSKSHQRSWWIVHARPTRERVHGRVSIFSPNPTNTVGGSFRLGLHTNASTPAVSIFPPNPTNAVGGSFTLGLHTNASTPAVSIFPSKSHQRSWWIVQARPTHERVHGRSFNLPSKSHQRSWWIVHARPTHERVHGRVSIFSPNPTNAVGGSFRLGLHTNASTPAVSIFPPNPTNAVGGSFTLGLHTNAFTPAVSIFPPNPTNAVGGSFTLGLHRRSNPRRCLPISFKLESENS
jgi:hypothetical protein